MGMIKALRQWHENAWNVILGLLGLSFQNASKPTRILMTIKAGYMQSDVWDSECCGNCEHLEWAGNDTTGLCLRWHIKTHITRCCNRFLYQAIAGPDMESMGG